MSKDKHPTQMDRASLELEVLALRILCKAYHECIMLEELVDAGGSHERIEAASRRAHALYYRPEGVRH